MKTIEQFAINCELFQSMEKKKVMQSWWENANIIRMFIVFSYRGSIDLRSSSSSNILLWFYH